MTFEEAVQYVRRIKQGGERRQEQPAGISESSRSPGDATREPAFLAQEVQAQDDEKPNHGDGEYRVVVDTPGEEGRHREHQDIRSIEPRAHEPTPEHEEAQIGEGAGQVLVRAGAEALVPLEQADPAAGFRARPEHLECAAGLVHDPVHLGCGGDRVHQLRVDGIDVLR